MSWQQFTRRPCYDSIPFVFLLTFKSYQNASAHEWLKHFVWIKVCYLVDLGGLYDSAELKQRTLLETSLPWDSKMSMERNTEYLSLISEDLHSIRFVTVIQYAPQRVQGHYLGLLLLTRTCVTQYHIVGHKTVMSSARSAQKCFIMQEIMHKGRKKGN